jgi:hypothetical protein
MLSSSAIAVKKSGGFSIINFDDYPEYEPLENTLMILRNSASNRELALETLLDVCTIVIRTHLVTLINLHSHICICLQIEISDLFEHPQWSELKDLLCKYIKDRPPTSTMIKVQSIHDANY